MKYLRDKETFLEHVFIALRQYFADKSELEVFLEKIPKEAEKDLFLKTVTFYRFLVLEGRFTFDNQDLGKGLKFIDDSYKYMAIFSLIESLYIGDKYVDFYDYVKAKKNKISFPIESQDHLDRIYEKYKKEHGAVRNALKFFDELDEQDKAQMFKKFKIAKGPDTIIKLANELYKIRSHFAHKAKFVLGFGANPCISMIGKKVLVNDLQMKDLMKFFEHGLLRHFGYKGSFLN